MKQFSKTLFFIVLLMAGLVPATIFAQDSYTITSLGDKGAWDDPDTEEIDESSDGVCDDGSGLCTLCAAVEEAVHREKAVR